MQFSCDSCKTQLQIADEKVRGKRLVVRCKRCGAKITITDPALAGKAVIARPAASPASAPPPAAAAPVPVPAPVPVSAPAPAPAPAPASQKRDSDTESTRAMDSELLEKALEASKSENPEAILNGAAASRPPPAAAEPQAGDPAIWFAMLHGKQAGPLTRGELSGRVTGGEIGPRTYLWKEGMDAWQRAREVPELTAMFPAPAEAPLPPPPAVQPELKLEVEPGPTTAKFGDGAPEQTEVDPLPLGERVHQDLVAKDLFNSGELTPPRDLANWGNEHPRSAIDSPPETSPVTPASDSPHLPATSRPMFESSAPTARSRMPLAIFLAVLLAAAGVVVWAFFGQDKKEGDQPPAPTDAVLDAGAPAPTSPPQQAAPEKPADAPPAVPVTPAPTAGLTADQVRRKLDDNKAALQGCIDEALHRDPNLRVGKIHIATTIAPGGQVTAAKIDKKTVDESPLGACLKKATRKIAFPPFGGEAFDVDIPIVVTAGE
jgi:predicted Zn finger-like uncharacterized protein